ncbi:MAG: hypothetical protein AAB244_01745 [Nitrospirota bacterium]
MNEAIKKHIIHGLEKNVRFDGRKCIELRNITIDRMREQWAREKRMNLN